MYRYSQSPSLLSLVVIVQDPSRSFPWFISCTFGIVHSYIKKSNGFSCNKVHGSQYCSSHHMCCVLYGENVLNCWQMEKKEDALYLYMWGHYFSYFGNYIFQERSYRYLQRCWANLKGTFFITTFNYILLTLLQQSMITVVRPNSSVLLRLYQLTWFILSWISKDHRINPTLSTFSL